MPPKSPNPPLAPNRSLKSIMPFKGKYFCCVGIPLDGIDIVSRILHIPPTAEDGTIPPPGPVIGTNVQINYAQNLIHFLSWAKHYFDSTPPLLSNREMNIDNVHWYVQVQDLKTRAKRYFFPEEEEGGTPITGLAYSFLEATVEDLTFPDKKVSRRLRLEFTCPYPEEKKFGKCPEYYVEHGLKKGRAYGVTVWDRQAKVVAGEKKTECDVKEENKKPEGETKRPEVEGKGKKPVVEGKGKKPVVEEKGKKPVVEENKNPEVEESKNPEVEEENKNPKAECVVFPSSNNPSSLDDANNQGPDEDDEEARETDLKALKEMLTAIEKEKQDKIDSEKAARAAKKAKGKGKAKAEN